MGADIHTLSCEDAIDIVTNCSWGFALVSPEGIFDWCNRAYAEQVLNAPIELVIGKHFRAFTHPDDVEIDIDLATKVKTGEIPGYTLAKRYIQRGSTPQVPKEIWGLLSVSGKYSETGEFAGYLVHFRPYAQNKKPTKINLKEIITWTQENWKYLIMLVTVVTTLIYGNSERLSTILKDVTEAKESVDTVLQE